MPVHLHTHSWYSLLEGTSSPDALLERAVAHGYTSLALTDTNNLYGASAFVESAHGLGIRPLLGARLRQNRYRCVVLIADRTGAKRTLVGTMKEIPNFLRLLYGLVTDPRVSNVDRMAGLGSLQAWETTR